MQVAGGELLDLVMLEERLLRRPCHSQFQSLGAKSVRDRLSRTGARKGGIRGKEALSSICKLAYKDLVDERSAIFDTLMKLDCIPAGMESFPAFDEEQLEYIRRIIDDIDYYVLIIAGRYESLTEGEISFHRKRIRLCCLYRNSDIGFYTC